MSTPTFILKRCCKRNVMLELKLAELKRNRTLVSVGSKLQQGINHRAEHSHSHSNDFYIVCNFCVSCPMPLSIVFSLLEG